MLKHPGRLIGGLFAVTVVGIALAIIGSNVRTGSLERDVRSDNLEAVRSALQARPELSRLKLRTQGSRARWSGRYLIQDIVADGNVAVATLLAQYGADLSVRHNGESLLHIAAKDGRLEMIRWLVSMDANVNDRNDCKGCEHAGRTPLHLARDREASELLLSLGADARAADLAGRTPLHVTGSTETATVLCAYGADIGQRDRGGATAFDLAQRVPAQAQEKPGQHADWIRPGGGCERLAMRARSGVAPDWDAVWDAYRQYVCARGQSPELRNCPKPS